MFDKQYYEQKRARLSQDFVKVKDQTLQGLLDLSNKLVEANNKFQEDIKEIEAILKDNDSNIIVPNSVKKPEVIAPEKK